MEKITKAKVSKAKGTTAKVSKAKGTTAKVSKAKGTTAKVNKAKETTAKVSKAKVNKVKITSSIKVNNEINDDDDEIDNEIDNNEIDNENIYKFKKFLENTIDLWQGTEEQINLLLNLKYKNSDKLIGTDNSNIKEIIGLLIKYKFDLVYNFIKEAKNNKDILWKNEYMNNIKNIYIKNIFENKDISDIQESTVYQCFKCKGRKINTVISQKRSGDEASTYEYNCLTCGNKWAI